MSVRLAVHLRSDAQAHRHREHLDEPGWQNTTVLRGDLVAEVRALKEADGRDIVATGSIQLVRALIAAGLVDEFRLFVFPVVAGRGARLFDDIGAPLRLLETRPFASGAVLLRYAAATSASTPATMRSMPKSYARSGS